MNKPQYSWTNLH